MCVPRSSLLLSSPGLALDCSIHPRPSSGSLTLTHTIQPLNHIFIRITFCPHVSHTPLQSLPPLARLPALLPSSSLPPLLPAVVPFPCFSIFHIPISPYSQFPYFSLHAYLAALSSSSLCSTLSRCFLNLDVLVMGQYGSPTASYPGRTSLCAWFGTYVESQATSLDYRPYGGSAQ